MSNRDRQATFRLARRALPIVASLTLAAFVIIEGGARLVERARTELLPDSEVSAPNILVIVIDTLRSDHLSAYGYRRNTSPAIDRLAANGVQFMNAFSTSSYTLPTHVSMLTGLYPAEHGVTWANSHWGIGDQTLPEVLLENGYRTGAFSGNTYYFSREHGFGRGFLHFEDFFHSLEDMAWRTAYGGLATRLIRPLLGLKDIPGRKHATDTNRAVIEWTHRDPSRPYFAMINYMDVHDPYMPPQPFRGMFSPQDAPGGLLNFKPKDQQPVLTPRQRQSEIDAYDGAIAYVDHSLERLISKLSEDASSRELVVIVTSDHGEEFGEHGGYLHARHIYRELIQVPLIIWAPKRVPAGVRVTQAVSNVALPATIMAILGDQREQFNGPSLDKLWGAGGNPDSWPPPLVELTRRLHAPEDDPIHHGSLRSLVSHRWQYIEQRGLGDELFDLSSDPEEQNNLADEPELQPILNDFAGQLAQRKWQHEP